MENDAFRLAAGNSIRFELVSVPWLIVISLVVAIEVHGMKSNIIKFAFLIPMAIPSNSLTVVWRILFDDQGVVNNMIIRWGLGEPVSFLSGRAVFWLFVCTFIFKNIGYNMLIWLSGLSVIPVEIYDAAKLMELADLHRSGRLRFQISRDRFYRGYAVGCKFAEDLP